MTMALEAMTGRERSGLGACLCKGVYIALETIREVAMVLVVSHKKIPDNVAQCGNYTAICTDLAKSE